MATEVTNVKTSSRVLTMTLYLTQYVHRIDDFSSLVIFECYFTEYTEIVFCLRHSSSNGSQKSEPLDDKLEVTETDSSDRFHFQTFCV